MRTSLNAKQYDEKEIIVILAILKLQELADNHIHKDEITGNYLVVPIEKFQKILTSIEESSIIAFNKMIHDKHKKYEPLRDYVQVLQKKIIENGEKYKDSK
jgi:hypothetical protein|tara:strand:- start:102 stop:404 length:303 start_codon:yes stop_codon:yes gene_type:complete